MNRCQVCNGTAVHYDHALCLTCSDRVDTGEVRYHPDRGWHRAAVVPACPLCNGERRVYSCWDEAKCPMAQDGGCADCASACPECCSIGYAEPRHIEGESDTEWQERQKAAGRCHRCFGWGRNWGSHSSEPCRRCNESGIEPNQSQVLAGLCAETEVVLPTRCDTDVYALREDFR